MVIILQSFYMRTGLCTDVDPKSGPRKENTEHGLEVRKIY